MVFKRSLIFPFFQQKVSKLQLKINLQFTLLISKNKTYLILAPKFSVAK